MAKRTRGFKWRRFPPVQFLLYAAARALICAVQVFRPEHIHRIGRFLAKFFYAADVKHRRIAEKNVARAEGMPKNPGEIARFVRRVYEHMGILTVETSLIPRLLACHEVERFVRLEGRGHLDAVLGEGRGAILVIAHLGNWELAGLACAKAGLPMSIIARPVENPLFNAYLLRSRSMFGTEILEKYGVMGAASDALRRNRVLTILADQDARKGGVFVPFFGRPASTVKTPALFALKYGVPILPAYTYRVGRNRHVAVIEEPIRPRTYGSIQEGVEALTAAYTSRFEGYIHRHPEQWMWLHARWKTKPEEEGVPEGGGRRATVPISAP